MKLILFGYGYWGKIWEKTIKKSNNELVLIIDPLINNSLKMFKNIRNIDFDLAIIATPIKEHYNISKLILSMGKRVLLEKPGTTDLKSINELIKLDINKLSGIGYTLLYCSAIDIIKKKNWDYARFHRSNGSSQIRKDCNVIYDLLCHDIALAYYIFNSFPKILFVDKNIDTVNCILKFDTTVCYFYCSRVDTQKLSNCTFISKDITYYYDDIPKILKMYEKNNVECKKFEEYPLDNQLDHAKIGFKANLNFGRDIHKILELI